MMPVRRHERHLETGTLETERMLHEPFHEICWDFDASVQLESLYGLKHFELEKRRCIDSLENEIELKMFDLGSCVLLPHEQFQRPAHVHRQHLVFELEKGRLDRTHWLKMEMLGHQDHV